MKCQLLKPAFQAVLPTPTVLLSYRVEAWGQFTCEVKNLDASQTLDVRIWRRCSDGADFSLSDFDPFSNMQPGESRCADMDVSGSLEVRLVAQASGAGLQCRTAGILVEFV